MAKQIRALLVEFDITTGKRAGNVSCKDPKLLCHGWQKLDGKNSLEIRLVEDDRDLSQYDGVKGVTVLKGKAVINQAIETNIPNRYGVADGIIMKEAINQKKIDLGQYAGKDSKEIHEDLFKKGVAGIVKREPNKL